MSEHPKQQRCGRNHQLCDPKIQLNIHISCRNHPGFFKEINVEGCCGRVEGWLFSGLPKSPKIPQIPRGLRAAGAFSWSHRTGNSQLFFHSFNPSPHGSCAHQVTNVFYFGVSSERPISSGWDQANIGMWRVTLLNPDLFG